MLNRARPMFRECRECTASHSQYQMTLNVVSVVQGV